MTTDETPLDLQDAATSSPPPVSGVRKKAALLDTNSWIRLGAVPAYIPKLQQLRDLKRSDRLHIIVSEVQRDEFQRHRTTIEAQWKKNIERFADLDELKKILPTARTSVIENLELQLRTLTVEALGAEPISLTLTDEILGTSTCIASNEVRLAAAARRSLAKEPPSHQKVSLGDCLIWDAVIAHLDTYDVFFQTANHKDFCDPTDPTKLHASLLAEAQTKVGTLTFVQSVDTIIEHFETLRDPLTPFASLAGEGAWYLPGPPTLCPRCSERNSFDPGRAMLRSQFGGLTLQYRCRHCSYLFDTGDSFD